MKLVQKQLVIDKDVFQGTRRATLCQFVKNHFLVLPEVLSYECLTDPENKSVLKRRFEQVMSAGAYICPSAKRIVFREGRELSPCQFLPDLKMTTDIRGAIRKKRDFFDSHLLHKTYEERCKSASILIDSAPKTVEKIAAHDPGVLVRAKKYQASRSKRFALWVETVTKENIHDLVIEKLGYSTQSPGKFCLSNEWATWYYCSLLCVIYLEYTFLRTVQDEAPDWIKAEHDCQDIEYVTYLLLADGLLTRDKKLIIPVAKAAFPEKDVFSSLDEVPKEYMCNWS